MRANGYDTVVMTIAIAAVRLMTDCVLSAAE